MKNTSPARRQAMLIRAHRELIEGSAIPREYAKARGYRTVTSPARLRKLGFSEAQSRLVPGLLIPVWDIFGENARYQLRPDAPRADHQSGRPRKYENLPGAGVVLDVHPRARKRVQNPGRPLLITEGIRKGDAAVAQGLACIALLGVWNWRGTDESGAVMALADWDRVPLKSRTVYIVFDSDVMTKRSVKIALERLTWFLRRRGATVKLIYLPPLDDGSKQGLDDWFAQGRSAEELLQLAEDQVRGLPEVVVNGRQHREVLQDALVALETANDPPQVYRWAQTLARVRVDENGRPFVEPYDAAAMKGQLAVVADYYRVLKVGDHVHTPPPEALARDILALPEWSFPVLDAVVETPTIREDGSTLDSPGYDGATRLAYVPEPDFAMPSVPDKPTPRWLTGARTLLLEVLQDFPFVNSASRANALALLITPLLRPAIRGPVPMALLDAPQAGTGKSLLAEVVAALATGRPAEMMSPCKDDDEWRKQVTATLIKGPSLVVIDNVMGRFSSATLARALTATAWKDRILGFSEDAVLPQRATWIATGNNILLGGDLPRRCYWVQLNAEAARPWLRSADEFAHPRLLEWVRENRPQLLAAVLGLARAWFAEGCPPGDHPSLGSYEDWCRVVGGVLSHAGVDHFLGNLSALYDTLDPGEEEWAAFLAAWYTAFGPKLLHARDIYTFAGSGQPLADVLPDELAAEYNVHESGRFVRKLGWALRNRQRRPYGPDELYVVGEKDKRTKAKVWRVVKPS